ARSACSASERSNVHRWPVTEITSTRVAPSLIPHRASRSIKGTPDQRCSLHHPPVQSSTTDASRLGSALRSAYDSSTGRGLVDPLTRRRHVSTSTLGTLSRLQIVTGKALPVNEPAWRDPL